MKKNVISVIVPIFNISKYLDKCIESILNQSYSDLEIILVDDGSSDNSGSICDYYATMDKRIRVIHKENGGLVSARKAGLEIATGEYIAFVDGDDWIDAEMYSEMLELCIKNDADFVESGYTYERNGVEVNFFCKDANIYLNDDIREGIIKEWMCSLETAPIRSTIWSKLYRIEIIKEAYENVNKMQSLGEDFLCYLHLIKSSKRVVVTSKIYYHYSFRDNSLSHDTSIGRLRNSCGLYCKCCELIREIYPSIDENKVNAWFAQHTVEDFYKLNFDKEVPTPIYKIDNIDELRGKKIVIYGAGNVGKDVYIQLCKYGDIKIVDWIDRNSDRYNYPYYTVHSASILPELEYDVILIAVLREKVAKSIKSDILEYGCSEEKVIWKEIVKAVNQFIPEPVGYNIVRFIGGLGNQMFQYAFYRALQEKGQKVKASIDSFTKYSKRSFELPKVFPNVKLCYDEDMKYESYKNSLSFHELYQETENGVYDAEVFKRTDCSMSGYWQSEKYFENIKENIREELIFEPEEARLIKLAERIRSEKNSVSLHVRRGDYMETPEMYGNICTVEYYNRALKFVKEKLQNPIFYVFSDDLEWTKNNIKIPNANYISDILFQDYQNWYDMFLMSCCHHNIIANSSFSWWGAWLNTNEDKVVISPNKWINGEHTKDIWCSSWIRM